MSALKPCPFCGGEANNAMRLAPEQWLYCKQCDAAGPMVSTHIAAIAAWNRRAGDGENTALRAELDAVKGALAEVKALLRRYRNETPLGHQPHMIAHRADAALGDTP